MAEDPRAGVQTGPNRTGFVFFVDVLPGHEKALREYFETNQGSPGVAGGLEEIGTLHEFRWVMFDDDRRLFFASSFDGRFDQDFASGSIGVLIDTALQHCEGWVGISDPGATEWFLEHAVPPAAGASAYPEPSVRQIWKALALQEAFEQVLDDPDGAEALQNPALKPLLEQAAD
jgi:hypothetical protein